MAICYFIRELYLPLLKKLSFYLWWTAKNSGI